MEWIGMWRVAPECGGFCRPDIIERWVAVAPEAPFGVEVGAAMAHEVEGARRQVDQPVGHQRPAGFRYQCAQAR